jgi:glycosyltransferase involved in cell wall biosynthesis
MSAAPSREPTTEVEVSVVIAFRNAAPHIRDQLEALAQQDFAGTWEIIAVDNGSSDESRQLAEAFTERLNLHIVDAAERPGAAWATNVGVRSTSGRKLIFIDADDEVAPGYLSAMGAALDEHDFIISAFDHETLNPDWMRSAQRGFSRDPENPLVDHFGVLPSAGGSVGITRTAFDAVGGFPEEFPRMYDIAMSWEVQFGGTSLHHVPEAVCRVRHRGTLRDLFRQSLAGASCAPLLYKRYRTAGMRRRKLPQVFRSWARLLIKLARARTKTEFAPLVVQLGRELGRLNGSLRYRVFFP